MASLLAERLLRSASVPLSAKERRAISHEAYEMAQAMVDYRESRLDVETDRETDRRANDHSQF